jgi:predicted CXXCH cytochrome family protein
MRYRWSVRLAAVGLLVVGSYGGSLVLRGAGGAREVRAAEAKAAAEKPATTSKLPPLVVDKSEPLTLDGPEGKPGAKPKDSSQLNTACYVCHANYSEESMVVEHAKEKVGCIDCHGQSFAHRDDEDNITPPDIMFPAEKVDVACQKCHDTHDAPAKKVLKRWQERCPAKQDFAAVVCTDCHGEHRLDKRTVRWDKTTRKLVLSAKTKPTAEPGEAAPSEQKSQ